MVNSLAGALNRPSRFGARQVLYQAEKERDCDCRLSVKWVACVFVVGEVCPHVHDQ
jgi:hypothetical protein